MMYIRSIGILLIFLMLKCDLFAQSIITADKDITQFLKQKEVCYDEKYGLGTAFAVNLLTFEGVTTNDKYGLYKIGTFNSHSSSHLMWLENGKKHFIDCIKNLSETLQKVFALWKESKCKLPDSEKLIYIEQIISIFDNNQPNLDELEPNVIMIIKK